MLASVDEQSHPNAGAPGNVATAFLRRRPLVVAPMFAIVLLTLVVEGRARTSQLQLLAIFGVVFVAFFGWEAWRGRRVVFSRRALFVSLLVTLLGITFASFATGGASSPLLLMAFAPTVVGFSAFGRGRASNALLVAGVAFFVLLALAPNGVPFPPLGEGARRVLLVVCGTCSLVLLRLGVSALSDAHSAARDVASRAGENIVDVAASRNEALEAMGARVAHEVRNPLSAIRALVEVLAEKADDDRNRKRFEVIRTEVDRIDDILTGYLSFARPLQRIERRDVNGREVIDDVAAIFAARIETAGISLTVDGPSVMASMDPRRIKEALLNLLLNAMDATPRGGRIALRVRAEEQDVVFTVEDSGVGMTAAQRERAGIPFSTDKAHGTGLGLALTRQAARDHGGDLIVDSEVGRGTQMSIRFPRAGAPS